VHVSGLDSLQEAGSVDTGRHQLTLKYLDHQQRLIWERGGASDSVVAGTKLRRASQLLSSRLILVMSESPQEDKPQLPNKKSDELQAKKDRSLAEFLLMLDDFKPLVRTNIRIC
jgi:hypothetical protein